MRKSLILAALLSLWGAGCDEETIVIANEGPCGDGVLHDRERCDDGNLSGDDYCAADCRRVTGRCGDGALQGNETCDDGNVLAGDDCAADCKTITGGCGDGTVGSGERCDDGNAQAGDYCAPDCRSVTGFCGDSVRQSNEGCDDGDIVDAGNGCTAQCQCTSVCGDGFVESGCEACDDSNTVGGDYCSADCRVAGSCGDGVVQPKMEEECDDGNHDDNDYCAEDCSEEYGSCGDENQQGNEACDDGNTEGGDYCSSDCQQETGECGDGVIQPGAETCDDAGSNGSTYCEEGCDLGACGDGEVQGWLEECDDGNTAGADYCTADCQTVTGRCGDGIRQANEACDDSNSDPEDYCNCASVGRCGDNTVQSTNEECDDGNAADDLNGCSAACQINAECGNAIVEDVVEECEDGNEDNGDGCDNNCTVTACGNGIATLGEACDDGNVVAGDGCDASCGLEVGNDLMDYDVGPGGGLFTVRWKYGATGYDLMGRCYDPAGALRLPEFQIASIAHGMVESWEAQVLTAKSAGTTLVSWHRLQTQNNYSSRIYQSRLYDSSCAPLGAELDWPASPMSSIFVDAAMNADGSFVLLWPAANGTGASLSYYSAAGALLSTSTVTTNSQECNGSYAIHVALAGTSGAGVVSCQRHYCDALYYRRFSTVSRTFTDAAMVLVPQSQSCHSAWSASHILAMLPTGEFAIEWQDYQRQHLQANLYAADGTLQKNLDLGTVRGYGYEGFRGWNQPLAVVAGRYVFRSSTNNNSNPELLTHWLYSGSGALEGCDRSRMRANLVRAAGEEWIYGAHNTGALTRGPLDFSSWNGCAPPTCGDGDVDSGESCDDGASDPFDGCDQFCKLERCGDARVTNHENCDDGNTQGGDGCDSVCGFETQFVPTQPVYFNEGIEDFDVGADGTVIITRYKYEERTVYATCLAADGTTERAWFPVSIDGAGQSPQVHRSHESGRSVIFFYNPTTRGRDAVVLDEHCFIARPQFQVVERDRQIDSVAIDAAGNFVVAWSNDDSAYLVFFDKHGRKVAGDLQVDEGTLCGNGYGMQVALAPTIRSGVVTCQQENEDPILYRRFTLNDAFSEPALLDALFRKVPDTEGNSWSSRTHGVAMDDSGAFVVEWQNGGKSRYEAAFLTWSGSLQKHDVLGVMGSNDNEAFDDDHANLERSQGSFVLRDGNENRSTFWLYSPAGERLGCDQTREPGANEDRSDYYNYMLRTGGQARYYLTDGSQIWSDVLDFNRWIGCARPTCGNLTVDPGEDCDDGNLTPYDGCTLFCRAERCGDGVVTGTERCDDGNLRAGDGCNGACQVERASPSASPLTSQNGVHDFDTSSDGSLVRLESSGEDDDALWATCFNADRTVKRARFPITYPGGSYQSPMVTTSRKAKRALVSWYNNGDSSLYGALLDGNCLVAKREFRVLQRGYSQHDAAIDDSGRSVVVSSGNRVSVSFYDTLGRRIGQEHSTDLSGSNIYAAHVAMNQSTGAGVVTFQYYHVDSLYYRRFASDFTWQDASWVKLTGLTVWYNYSHAVGMNDKGEFVILWREYNTPNLKARFFDAAGEELTEVTISSRTRSTEYGSYDHAFYLPHQEVPIVGDDFLIPEVFRNASGADEATRYFRYGPTGNLIAAFTTTHGMAGGLSARLDGQGRINFRRYNEIFFEPLIFETD